MNEEELQELTALRQEKQLRAQEALATAALTAAGVPTGFAALLAGQEDAATQERTEAFCAAWQTALTEEVRKRLPDAPPAQGQSPAAAPRPQRGVRILR